MSPMSLHEQMVSKVAVVREYREGDALLHVLGLLELIELSYKERLADVAAEDLHKVQGALRQAKSLKEAIFGPPGSVPLL
jgi:hypothetical protein